MAESFISASGHVTEIINVRSLIRNNSDEPTKNAIQLRTPNLTPLYAPECLWRRLSSI